MAAYVFGKSAVRGKPAEEVAIQDQEIKTLKGLVTRLALAKERAQDPKRASEIEKAYKATKAELDAHIQERAAFSH